LASGAPPTSLARPRGIPRQALSQNVSPAICPLGVRCLFRVLRSASTRVPLRRPAPPKGDVSFQSFAGLPLVGFLLPRTPLRRVPLLRRNLPRGRPRGTRVARPSSVPSSGFLPLSTVPASTRRVSESLDPAVCRGPQRFAAFFHAARVPGASLQSFPFPRSRTRSRGPRASLWVRVRPPPAQRSREIHDRFRRSRRALCPANPPGGGSGRMSLGRGFLAVARPVASTHPKARRTYRPLSVHTGLAG